MWAQGIACVIGLWLMAAPDVLGYGAPAATNDRIVGPVAASIAGIALWQVARALRWANVLLAVWLLLAPAVFGYDSRAGINSVLSGALLGAVSLIRGRARHSYAGGWRSLFERAPSQTR